MATRAPPALMDELVEEILLRIPPDDPARLVRASTACKRWCRLVCAPGFRRRFRERHRTPPFLGFIRDCDDDGAARFVPTCSSSFRPRRADRRGWCAVDCRHGRVLLRRELRPRNHARSIFAVWDPVTDVQRELPALPPHPQAHYLYGGNAAVLCADRGGGCDHLDCHDGPYLVLFVGTHDGGIFVSMYSSEVDAWGEPTSTERLGCLCENLRGAHAGNALYFVFVWETTNDVFTSEKTRILEYDLVSGEMTLIDPPPMDSDLIVLTTLESGGLGCVAEKGSGLYLWLREAGLDKDMRWVQGKLIEYKIPDGHRMVILDVFGCADGGGVIYAGTDHGAFTTDLKSGRSMKVGGGVDGFEFIVPFVSFYTPALRVSLKM